MSRRGRVYAPIITPQQSGTEEAQKAIAKADALFAETQRRKAAVVQQAQTAPFGKWGTSLDKNERQAYDRSPDAYGSQTSQFAADQSLPNETSSEGRRRMATQREQAFTGFFGKRAQASPVSSAGPVGPTVTTTPSGGGSAGPVAQTTFGQYGGGSQRQLGANELLQPYFANEKGDQTHTVLSKTPGEDPRLDPVYAANVFRNAGDAKTAAAYEKYASTMDPSKFTGPNGSPWQNPHFGPPSSTVSTPPALGAPAAPAPTGSPLDVLTPPPPANFQASLGAAPEETFAGKPLSQITDVTSATPAFPSRSFQAGQAVAGAVRSAFDFGSKIPTGALALAKSGVTSQTAPGADIARSAREFVKGAGASTPAGVSRATVADFGQPTKDNPAPTTPTTPPAAPSAIASFGGLNSPVKPTEPPPEKKYAFAGF